MHQIFRRFLQLVFHQLANEQSLQKYANVRVDNNYIYESFGSGAVNKYKISNRTSTYVTGNLKGSSGFNYDVTLDLNMRVLKVNKKDRKTGILSNDIILSVNGINVNSIKDFYLTAWSLGGPGTSIKLEVERNQKKITFDIKTVDRMDYFVKPKYL